MRFLKVVVPVFSLLLVVTSCGGRKAGSSGNNNNNSNNTVSNPLQATIRNPNGNVAILAGDAINLRADFRKGDNLVTPETVSWMSSVQGVLGATNPLNNVLLSAGSHQIQVSGTLGTEYAQAQVAVTVGDFAVRILNPDNGTSDNAGSNLLFDGQARVLDGAVVVTLVSGVAGAGERQATFSWTSSIDGVIGSADNFNFTPSVGTHTITLTVTDNLAGGSGKTGSASISLVIRPPNVSPTVSITSPASCPVDLEQGQLLSLLGSVADPDPADAGIVGLWTESVSGVQTQGNSMSFGSNAVLGKHELVFSATDTQGASDRATCAVFVIPVGGSRGDLFPVTTALNNNLQGGNTNIRWIGNDGAAVTLIGNNEGVTSFDTSNVLLGSFDGQDLGFGTANAPIYGVAVTSDLAFVSSSEGLSQCDYAAGLFSNCSQISPQEFVAVAASGSSASHIVAAGAVNGLFVDIAGSPIFSGSFLFNENNSNLPDNQVNDVWVNGSTIYVGTDKGLCIITAADAAMSNPGINELCSTIVTRDNSVLQSEEVTAVAYDGTLLWLGTQQHSRLVFLDVHLKKPDKCDLLR